MIKYFKILVFVLHSDFTRDVYPEFASFVVNDGKIDDQKKEKIKECEDEHTKYIKDKVKSTVEEISFNDYKMASSYKYRNQLYFSVEHEKVFSAYDIIINASMDGRELITDEDIEVYLRDIKHLNGVFAISVDDFSMSAISSLLHTNSFKDNMQIATADPNYTRVTLLDSLSNTGDSDCIKYAHTTGKNGYLD